MGLPAAPLPNRLTSLDAYRGFIMLAMASAGLAIPDVAKQLPEEAPGKAIWDFFASQTGHVAWTGCSFWDLIQPAFMFMVGVAMPFSHASRLAKGQTPKQIAGHVVLRSLILIALGVFLMSTSSQKTNFNFVNVLTQIGLGYAFVYLLLGRGFIVQLLAAAAILGGYWYLFYSHPLPSADLAPKSVGATASEWFTGLFAHWNKNANFASDIDHRFLGLFPYSDSNPYNPGGYTTLNFIPSMATMIFGLMAGEMLKSDRQPSRKLGFLIVAGGICLAGGWYLGDTVCPIVKRIWTPSWAVYSAGWTFLMLAGFYSLIDMAGYRGWAFPLVVVGMNSIAMYCMSMTMKGWIRGTLRTHIGQHIFDGPYGPMVAAASVLAFLWLVCYWLYRQRIFIRI
jgi:heparan-alpha-glucosaminide N-acetyltransferase